MKRKKNLWKKNIKVKDFMKQAHGGVIASGNVYPNIEGFFKNSN